MKSSRSLLAILVAAPALGQARPVRNAFVNRKVVDTRGLVEQVRRDGEVADRYERHFAMDRSSVLRYLGSLHRGALAKAGYFTIYSVPEGGRLKMHVGRLRKGEPMFLDRKGAPVLVVKCGNPVVLGPNQARHANPVALDAFGDEDAQRVVFDSPEKPAASIDEVVSVIPSEPLVAIQPPSASALDVPIETTAIVSAPPTVAASAISGGSNLLWPGLAAGLGTVSFLAGSHDHGPGQPVPEPATMVALAAGVGAFARRRRRSASRSLS